jgi:hypothetical protein
VKGVASATPFSFALLDLASRVKGEAARVRARICTGLHLASLEWREVGHRRDGKALFISHLRSEGLGEPMGYFWRNRCTQCKQKRGRTK